MLTPSHLQTEYLVNPLGINVRQPSFSWQLAATGRGAVQTAYQVQFVEAADSPADAAADLFTVPLWDSEKVLTPNTIGIPYAGPPLQARRRYAWRVRAWDGEDRPSPWSEKAWFEMGLLAPSDWRAEWVEVPWDEDPAAFKPCPYFRHSFTLAGPIRRARLYITAHGLYEAWLNGQRVGDQVFTPGFTAYDRRLQYQTYDVTDLLQVGANAIGAILGDGWYRGKVYVANSRNVYGERLGLLALLHIVTAAGEELLVPTGPEWKANTGPILKSDMKDGEVYDARRELGPWSSAAYDDASWPRVRAAAHPKEHLVAALGAPVRRKETFRPEILKTPNGDTVLDFGQNLAGVVRMRVRGPRGATVRLRHGEVLDAAGNFTVAHLFPSEPSPGKEPEFQEVQYTLRGEGGEEYEPRFTVHGFRYVQLQGYPGTPTPDDFTAVAIYSDMPPTGTFSCSEPLLNQLHHNVVWSMKGNFLDIPTDCPQRERAGWTGDIQTFTPSASFLMDTRAFLRKWLEDLKLEQFPSGMVGNFVPDPIRAGGGRVALLFRRLDGSAGWGDVATVMPWDLYWAYGDVDFLSRQYDSMKAWVEYVRKEASRSNWSKRFDKRAQSDAAWHARQPLIWDRGYHWGEWLEPGDGDPQQMVKGILSRVLFGSPVVATAYFARSAHILAQTAALLGRPDDAQAYRALADEIKAAYAAEFIAPDGRIEPDRQASYVRVLAFDLAPAAIKPLIVEHLVRLVRAAGNHVGTGFLSTVYLCQVLADNGRLDVAYDLLTQTTIPSWLYAVTKGATTIWETWEGIDEAGVPHASLNHYSPGAVVNFLHRTVAGIAAAAPGYRRITIHPQPGGGLTSAGATYASVHGPIASHWAKEDGVLRLAVTIPPNTTAAVHLRGARLEEVQESGLPLAEAEGVTGATQSGADTVVEVGSGEYRFEYGVD